MPPIINRNALIKLSFIFPVIFFLNEPLFSQNNPERDTTIKVIRGSFIKFREDNIFTPMDTIIRISGSLVKVNSSSTNKTITFYDSLKIRASRSMIGKALYDLVIVSPDTTTRKKITGNSQESYKEYSGMKIRKIQIRRLNVFGTDITNPGFDNPKVFEKLLNNTHINTSEYILRKYLLFAEGDTVSPLIMSDNERIFRELPFINDARIIVVPVSGVEADIVVVTRDSYSLAFEFNYRSPTSGTVSLFDNNFLGIGHGFRLDIPYSTGLPSSPGIGLKYSINNLFKSFTNISINYYNALGRTTYGFTAAKNLISLTTKYAGGISVLKNLTSINLDTLPQPLKYTYQDYWLERSFLLNRDKGTRFITGARYTNNNPFERPIIDENSYYNLQKYSFFIGTAALSIQKYYKTNLIYNYGRTEDIPYGALLRFSAGMEINEFKKRSYAGIDLSCGQAIKSLGYFYTSVGFGTFLRNNLTEQGVLSLRMEYFSNLMNIGSYRVRNFVNINFTRGFDRYNDEFLYIPRGDGFTGFRNDSLRGTQRLYLNLESVFFSPAYVYGFRFAYFGFADLAFLAANREVVNNGRFLSGIGLGVRIRNNNLIFNTLQIKIGFFPNFPSYSRISNINISGEELLHPENFDPGPPAVLPFR